VPPARMTNVAGTLALVEPPAGTPVLGVGAAPPVARVVPCRPRVVPVADVAVAVAVAGAAEVVAVVGAAEVVAGAAGAVEDAVEGALALVVVGCLELPHPTKSSEKGSRAPAHLRRLTASACHAPEYSRISRP
jgi:hypothetical protein